MPRMIAAQRRARIVELVNRRGILSVEELSRQVGASLMTIRRDLTLLDGQGVLRRTHGGAVALAAPRDVPFRRRERLELQAKAAIGRAAAALVQPGETILLDAGTTVLAMAHRLRSVRNLTVVTNSVQVLAELWHRPEIRVVALGGLARHGSGSLTGPLAEKALEEIRVDRAFLGTTGITPRWRSPTATWTWPPSSAASCRPRESITSLRTTRSSGGRASPSWAHSRPSRASSQTLTFPGTY